MTADLTPHALRTLVVDDDPAMRALLVTLCQARGHAVEEAGSGGEALERLTHAPSGLVDLVLTDWMLPDLDGLSVCRAVRAMPGGDRPVIAVVTARRAPGDLDAVLDAGADDYVMKPIAPEELSVRLRVLEHKVALREAKRAAQAALRDAYAELAEHHEGLRRTLDLLHVGSALTDEGGRLTFVSRAALEAFGLDAGALLGRPWQEAFPLDEPALTRLAELTEAAGNGEVADHSERVRTAIHRGDGRRFLLEAQVAHSPGASKSPIFFFYDVTELEDLRMAAGGAGRFHDLVGRSARMRDVYRLIEELAPVDVTVLIEGQTGTGKELVARAIHAASHRAQGPFVAVNCAGLSDELLASQLFGHRRGAFTGAVRDHVGVFEAAHGGTIFLDEIGDVSPRVQSSLLRVLQEREITPLGAVASKRVDVRVLAATHRDLAAEVQEGRFRADLLYRIRVARVKLPPLAERRADIPLLAASFLSKARALTGKDVRGLSPDALRALISAPWPGNVRELLSAVEFAVIRARGAVVEAEDLPPELLAPPTPTTAPPWGLAGTAGAGALRGGPRRAGHGGAEATDRERILEALEAARGNRTQAAALLGVSRATLYRMMHRHDVR